MCAGAALATLTRMPASWFPTTEEIDARAARLRAERGEWVPQWLLPEPEPAVDPKSVVVILVDNDSY